MDLARFIIASSILHLGALFALQEQLSPPKLQLTSGTASEHRPITVTMRQLPVTRPTVAPPEPAAPKPQPLPKPLQKQPTPPTPVAPPPPVPVAKATKKLPAKPVAPAPPKKRPAPQQPVTPQRTPPLHTPATEPTRPAPETSEQAPTRQDASEGIQWVQDADYRRNPPPKYPRNARRRKQQGLVVLLVAVGLDGKPTSVDVHDSSGHTQLDSAARKAVGAWDFEPSRRNGIEVATRVLVPIEFKLR